MKRGKIELKKIPGTKKNEELTVKETSEVE